MLILRKNRLYKLTGNTLFLLALVMLTGCAVSAGGYISGQVLEAETNQPLPNVFVIVTWEGREFAAVETRSVCVGVDSTLTDSEGRYRFLPRVKFKNPLIGSIQEYVDVHKYGYKQVIKRRREKGDDVYLIESDHRSSRDRLIYLINVLGSISCGVAEDKQSQLLPLYKTIYKEAFDITTNEEDRKIFLRIKHRITSNLSGSENSLTRKQSDEYFEENLKDEFQ